MYYSAIGVLALMILLIENQDILLIRDESFKQPAWKVYRYFLMAVIMYYVTDILWGVLESMKLATLLFIDTSVYYVAMASGVLCWTQYVVTYLDERKGFARCLVHSGRTLGTAVVVLSIVNIFWPIFFVVTPDCVYKPLIVRYVVLTIQIVLLFLLTFYGIFSIIRKKDLETKKLRYRALSLFGLIMAVLLTAQIWFPYVPLYTIAYMLGTSLLRTLVIGDEKEEFRRRMEAETAQAQQKVYIDGLTGVRNKFAYIEEEQRLDGMIAGHEAPEFAIVILDVNDLKKVNDTEGHQAGDRYIRSACRIICDTFKHSPVFRVGGDEFTVIVQGSDHECIEELMEQLYERNRKARLTGGIVIACGKAEYRGDVCTAHVFERADKEMYINKSELKSGRI